MKYLKLLLIFIFVVSLDAEELQSEEVCFSEEDFIYIMTTNYDESNYMHEQNLSNYAWNVYQGEWVNSSGLIAILLDRSLIIQDEESMTHLGDLKDANTGNIRGIRVGVAGTINFEKPWLYMISGGLGAWDQGSEVEDNENFILYDALISIPMWGTHARLNIGKMKEPISLERKMGMIFEQFMERPMHLDAFLLSRNTGFTFSDMILNERFTWSAGVFNNAIEQSQYTFKQTTTNYTARATAVAFQYKDHLLHLGAGFRYSDAKQGVQYSVGPEQYFLGDWVDTGFIDADSTSTVNLELTYLSGPFWLASEYTKVNVKSDSNENPKFDGYHVALNYILTGESRNYNYRKAIVQRVSPQNNFTVQGGAGAVELSTRYSTINLNDGLIQGGEMDISSIGATWHTTKDVQFSLQYSHVNLDAKDFLLSSTTNLQSSTELVQFRMMYLLD